MDERDLAQRAVLGDTDAFCALVQLHQAGVYNAAYRMTGNRQEAEDAAQEAFIKAFRSIGRLDPGRSAGPWLRKIVVNVCLNRLEKREALPLTEEARLVSPEPQPEPQVVEEEQNRQVRQALMKLSARQRAVITLRHFEGMTYNEMAEVLGRPLSDIKSDLFRARRLLVEELKDLA
jgi:RNA polymerase sigma-70 factor, ECF subfamily